ncbi:MAG: SDR family NAD(P)-dependent oxidoreductase [Hyphomonadaceae bacterium]|nr:SDR family NAD(P)-dependent oxidoreductase [Hyphomonadaceae bacterium]
MSRTVLVTGASRGIGRATAKLLAREGWHVIAAGRAQRALEELDDEIRSEGGAATLVPLDLKDGGGIDRLGAALFERWGRLDGLVGNAAVLGPLTPVHQATPGVMAEVLAVNVHANHRLIRSFHPLLRASDAGRAVFLTSGAAQFAPAYWGPYSSSKAALEVLVRTYAAECAITPVRANLFSPGPVRTAMRAKAFPGEDPETLPHPDDIAPHIVALLQPSCERNGEIVSPG